MSRKSRSFFVCSLLMVLASIQALRVIAALLVLLLHLGFWQPGLVGVDLFFVISGFVLYYTYHSRPSAVRGQKRRYIINRLSKIFLLYWTVLILVYIFRPFPLKPSLIGTILLFPSHHPILSISWSLSCELYFYALLGITLFYIPVRWHKVLFITAFLLTAGVKLLNIFGVNLRGTPVYFLAGPNLWEFLCGILAGAVVLKYSPRSVAKTSNPPSGVAVPYGSIAILLLVLFCALPFHAIISWYHFAYGTVALLLVVAVALAEIRRPWTGPLKDWIIRLGNASYAIYLFSPVIHLFFPIPTTSRKIAMGLILIVFSLFINFFYEEKMLRMVRNAAWRLIDGIIRERPKEPAVINVKKPL
jgi:exopolysaccharide production protein ExoZ